MTQIPLREVDHPIPWLAHGQDLEDLMEDISELGDPTAIPELGEVTEPPQTAEARSRRPRWGLKKSVASPAGGGDAYSTSASATQSAAVGSVAQGAHAPQSKHTFCAIAHCKCDICLENSQDGFLIFSTDRISSAVLLADICATVFFLRVYLDGITPLPSYYLIYAILLSDICHATT